MSLEFSNSTRQTARKEHVCDLCNRKISIGEKYDYCAGKFDGDFFVSKLHTECSEVINLVMRDMGENEYTPDMIADWWQENKCDICRHAYPLCVPDDNCPDDIERVDCLDHNKCKCMANGIDCDKMDRSCWCTLFESE